ncbi:MAG: diguanylate cyclase, partial [Pseudomonadota bacterium]|nr:diguanylate cyclase [Pseudomonadota bacterium]
MLSNISLNHKITVRYLIAVAFIALLSTSSYLSFSYLLKNNETTAAIINISGKQRMLSQRTALFSKQLVSANSSVEIDEIKSQLAQTVDMMQTGHLALISGSTDLHIPQKHSQDIHDMYFGELQMDKRVTAYIEAIQKLLSSPVNRLNTEHPDYLYINNHFNPLLVDLNNIVTQYQKEGEESVRTIQKMEFFLWLLTLFILLLEIQLIFRPMNKQVLKALEERETYEKRLEKEIKKQTKKLVAANIQLNKLSNTDPLTGLRNRRGLESKLHKHHRLYTENKNDYSLAIIDLDFFKNLNDTYGHDCGDTVLK